MPSNSSASLSGQSILVVEDEYFLADDVAAALRGIGAKVVGPVNDLSAATQAILSNTLDGAALDVNVRGQPIYPVAEALQSRGIPFVFMTGYGKNAILPKYQDVVHCEKPFDVRVLVSELAALVHSRR